MNSRAMASRCRTSSSSWAEDGKYTKCSRAPPLRVYSQSMACCFYCKDPRTSISVCVDCRTKFEIAQEENRRLRRELAIMRSQRWKKTRLGAGVPINRGSR